MSNRLRTVNAIALLHALAVVGVEPPTLVAAPSPSDRDTEAEAEAERMAAAEAKRARKAAKRARQFQQEPQS